MRNEIALTLSRTAERRDVIAEVLESVGPLSLVLGVLAALVQTPELAVVLLVVGVFGVYIAAILRDHAAADREAAERQKAAAKREEEEALRRSVLTQTFVLTDERLATLVRAGAGEDLLLALGNSRNGSPVIAGKLLLDSLDARLGIKRTTESLPLMLGYLADRRTEERVRSTTEH